MIIFMFTFQLRNGIQLGYCYEQGSMRLIVYFTEKKELKRGCRVLNKIQINGLVF